MKKGNAEARERIIRAATDLIGEQGGAEGLTIRCIAARAGVGVGLVNYHFQTKERLVNLCVQRIIGNVIEKFAPMYEGLDMAPLDKLRFLAKSTSRFLARNPGISRASILSDMLSPGEQDNTALALAAYAPAVREVCAGRATETEMRLLPHLLISSIQSAFLRGGVFKGFSGMDFSDETRRDQLVDMLVYIVFHKYL